MAPDAITAPLADDAMLLAGELPASHTGYSADLSSLTGAKPTLPVSDNALLHSIARATSALRRHQKPDGHFIFELEADATIPAEYVLLEHFLDRIDPALEQRIGVYLRGIQGEHGGWPLFHDGAFNLSASVKAYFALKAIGDSLTRRTCAGRGRPSWRRGARKGQTSSRGCSLRCSARCRGARCRSCRWRSCICRSGSRSTCQRCRTGRGPCWCPCSC